ncbi:glycosyltransferase [Microbacterium sp. RU33B]|uniref:glycosyltransferase n=1 Tax=Microbacterium sp. RU33B TaxID=1907390 RepID=UPI0009632A49|nr:glycosyltransferase [Microbacterium sp. RU33B]SIT67550.1 UDP:flavonoid glycosyltransferase YjiC, YdhE family [Microbacterium sp. RU33B]
MDVTFIANDTRGGVEPYLALAREAVSRGHRVRALAPAEHAPLFTGAGVLFAGLEGVDRESVSAAARGGVRLREMGRRVAALAAQWAVTARDLAAGTDVIVSGIGGMALARPVAQAVGATLLRAHLQPLDASNSAAPGPLGPPLDFAGPLGHRASHAVTAAATSLITRAPEQSARRALGLTGRSAAADPTILYGFSPAVVPVASDATTRRIATGYWTLPASAPLSPELVAFVEQPDPVVSIGFGSMVTADADALRRLVLSAVRRVGVRAVLLSGWGALAPDAERHDDVMVVDSAAHALLFPRMSATVHHGGAGTTGAALAAGRPTVVVPFTADQPFWARRAQQLGVAPSPLPLRRLTVDGLTEALRSALTDPVMVDRARDLGETLRREHGARDAVDAIEIVAGA